MTSEIFDINCRAMNTESTADGTKTRRFDKIVGELETAFRIHRAMGSYLGGFGALR